MNVMHDGHVGYITRVHLNKGNKNHECLAVAKLSGKDCKRTDTHNASRNATSPTDASQLQVRVGTHVVETQAYRVHMVEIGTETARLVLIAI
jgi:hypothetical protein